MKVSAKDYQNTVEVCHFVFSLFFPVGQPARHFPKLARRFRKITRNAPLKQIRAAHSNLLWRIYLSSTGRRRFNRRDVLALPFSRYGEVSPPICWKMAPGEKKQKKQKRDSVSDLLPGLVWHVLRGAGRLPSPGPTSAVKVFRPCSWHRGAHAKQGGHCSRSLGSVGENESGNGEREGRWSVETRRSAWGIPNRPGRDHAGFARQIRDTWEFSKRGRRLKASPQPLLRGWEDHATFPVVCFSAPSKPSKSVKTSEARLADFVARGADRVKRCKEKCEIGKAAFSATGSNSSSWGKDPREWHFLFLRLLTWVLHPTPHWCFASCNDKWQSSTTRPISEKKRLSCLAFLDTSIGDRSFFFKLWRNVRQHSRDFPPCPHLPDEPLRHQVGTAHLLLSFFPPPPLYSFCVLSSALAAGARRSLHV